MNPGVPPAVSEIARRALLAGYSHRVVAASVGIGEETVLRIARQTIGPRERIPGRVPACRPRHTWVRDAIVELAWDYPGWFKTSTVFRLTRGPRRVTTRTLRRHLHALAVEGKFRRRGTRLTGWEWTLAPGVTPWD